MPLKLNVGASRKVTDHNYGSRGASISLEMEVEAGLITGPQKLQDRIRQLFALVRASLTEELNGGGQHHQTNGHVNGATDGPTPPSSPGSTNGHANGSRVNGVRLATPKQCKALQSIAQTKDVNLVHYLQKKYLVDRPDDLTLKQASQAIDDLKVLANGHAG